MKKLHNCRKLCAIRRRLVYLCVLGIVSILCSAVLLSKGTTRFSTSHITLPDKIIKMASFHDVIQYFSGVMNQSPDVIKCPSVFPGMLRGRWVPKANVSEARKREMDEYLVKLRADYKIPRSLQRSDGKCGNLPYDGVPLFRHMWFRSVCNPQGALPCCYNFKCTNKTEEECSCPFCLDSRKPVHAELSDWLPEEPACRAREFNASEACRLLDGRTVVLVGDSFVRHIFVALVMLLTDNFRDGALKKEAPERIRRVCQGMYQINGLSCRDILDQDRILCGGRVNAIYLEIWTANKGRFLLPYLQMLVSRQRRVLLLVGIGIHDDFRINITWPFSVQPLAEYFHNFTRPPQMNSSHASQLVKSDLNLLSARRPWFRMIWVNAHAPNLLKSPVFPAQSFEGVRFYNHEMARLLKPFGVPILDSFNMTAPLHSVDGTHYGYGANILKVHFLLNWIKERQDSGDW